MRAVVTSVWLLSLLSCLANSLGEQPDVAIHLCKIPLIGSNWSLCCATKDIHSATVTFFHQSPESSKFTDVAVVKHTCDTNTTSSDYNVACDVSKVKGQRDLILTILNPSLQQDIGKWGCGYYGKTSSLVILETQVLLQDGGVVRANKSENVRLNFTIEEIRKEQKNVTIYNPEGVIIANISASGMIQTDSKVAKTLSFDTQNGIVSLLLQNLTSSENGTYVCEVQPLMKRYGLTLIVLEKLDKPKITPSNVTLDLTPRKVKHGTLTCTAVRKSAGPYYYTPQIRIRWIYPQMDVGYNILVNGSVLTITGVNCTTNRSQPIFCEAQEVSGPMSDRSHFYPHSLCNWSPSTPVPPTIIQGGDKNDSDRSLLIAMGVIGILGFALFGVMFCAGKKNVGRCCSFCCRKICRCCGRTICRKCTKMDDEFYSDYISNMTREADDPYFTISRDRGSNWRDLLNVYSPGADMSLPLPPALRESTNTDENENEESGPNTAAVATNDVVVTGAEGVDRSVLIKEVEHGLKELRKTLHNAQTQVQVSRENLVRNLFDIYTDPMIVDSYLHVKMVDEQGSDWGGVSRDCFTSFWNEVSENFFRGSSVLIPHLPPHRLEEEYKFRLLGRILAHSTAILGYIPVPLCKSVVMVTIFDTTTIEESTLLEDFLLFLDQHDARIVQKALTDFGSLSDEDRDTLQDMFSRFDMGCLIQESTFRDHFLKMARSELCIKPRSLCELIREGIPQIHYERFWSQLTLDHLQILNDRLKPTAEKIIACLRPDESELNSRTETVYEYFTDLIADLSQDDLEILLQFITGQACVPRRNITVNFSDLSGMERRPIAHTCSFSIELPDTYESYEEFEAEFRIFLKSDIIRFDIQ
ncbi:uncharacterized protein LOC110462793 isoform X2 [Mizuhopecten yessoensis]|uniref:HECT domain-containing protein n=1 Tax=Mizuhopecten yessoensis TaxID=6573 RepID=A0A210R2A0_MIZYE|nr:uncharacterized protein LOC110462793 isoform X2 [Mizuhopecten yessoensis]OWF55213.1 hypothetical protein KP79_PYT21958 [Mizuhopecten yessoensis]